MKRVVTNSETGITPGREKPLKTSIKPGTERGLTRVYHTFGYPRGLTRVYHTLGSERLTRVYHTLRSERYIQGYTTP